jgi:hypothetical protein
MALPPRRYNDGLAAALCVHLCIYCAVAACFGLGFYVLMQPSRSPNPGLAAYKPPPATVITSGLPARLSERERIPPFVVVRAEPGRTLAQRRRRRWKPRVGRRCSRLPQRGCRRLCARAWVLGNRKRSENTRNGIGDRIGSFDVCGATL